MEPAWLLGHACTGIVGGRRIEPGGKLQGVLASDSQGSPLNEL